MLSDLLYRIRVLFRRRQAESELEQELTFHVEREAEKYVAAGISKQDAIRQARLAFGGSGQVTDACRDARGLGWIETPWRDICYAIRTLRATPLFAFTVVACLSLGIGANTAVFTLMRVSLWKPLPVNNPSELFWLERSNPAQPDATFGNSYVLFQQLRNAAAPYGAVFAKTISGFNKFGTDSESRERAIGEAVSGNFFAALQVQPAAGRLFTPSDDNVLGANHVAVLSHHFWNARFQSNPSVLGQTIFYKETPYTVVGIAQPGFEGVDAETLVDIWVPITADAPTEWLKNPDFNWLRLFARVQPRYAPAQVQAVLDGRFRAHLTREILPGVPAHYKPMVEPQHLRLLSASAGLSTTGRHYEKPLLILITIVGLVLLISCANVANLVMARNHAREAEIAVRRALGASRGRIVAQLFVESLLLALLGTGCGLVLANWGCRLLISLLPQTQPPLAFHVAPDLVVLSFAAMVGVVTALLFGLAPAISESKAEQALTLKSGVRVTRRSLASKALVAGQLAVSLLLLIGAGLFLNTIRNLEGVDLGFHPEHVVTFDLSFPKATPDKRKLQSYEHIRERIARSTGVVAASYAWPSVYGNGGWSLGVEREGRPAAPGEDNEVGMIAIGADFFETIGLGLLEGRDLTVDEIRNGAPVMVVNQSLARYYFGNSSPIGQRIKFPAPPGEPVVLRTIVGVVRDARHYGVREKVWRMAYVPPYQGGSFYVRSNVDTRTLDKLIRTIVPSIDRSAQVEQIRPFASDIESMASSERMIAALSTCFAGLAALLASLGLYGVTAYGVVRRTPEVGIRVALGAKRGDVQWLVLRETIQFVVAGCAIGAMAALVLTRFVSSLLYGVKPNDPAIFAASALVLIPVAAIAAFIPAWQASCIDPVVALRHE